MAKADELPWGTVTFLLTDVEASTRLWEEHPGLAAAAVDRQRTLIDAAVRDCGGGRPLEQGEGDSVVAAFARASDAVHAAHIAQVAIASEPWPDGIGLRVRMAVHTGEVELRPDGTYAGAVLNRSARLRALGHGGQVLVSGATADLVVDDLATDLALIDLGMHRLRDLGRPERVFQLQAPGLGNLHPPLRSLDALPNNLPVEVSSFVGRADDLAQGVQLVGQTRLLTLTGAGGCGKTRLAQRVAAEVAERYPGGTWWVELAPLGRGTLVADAAAAAIGLPVPGERAAVDVVVDHLDGYPALIVLDNCEHLVDDTATFVHLVLSRCADATVMATSREPLNVDGEVTWRVPSLGLPPPDAEIDVLEQSDAVRLFIERAVQARPNFRVDNDSAPAVAQICHQLDGIPLALELAAARIRSLPPERIAHGLQDRFRLLASGSRVALPRQQTLWASVDWSHELLDDQERALLRRVAVFAGGFELDAAEAIAAFPPVESYAVLDVLDRLVDKSLVQVEDAPSAAGRYRLLETIRQYAIEQLRETDEHDDTSDRLLLWAEELIAEHQEGVTWAHGDALDALDAEHANIRAALDWALEARPDAALRMVGALGMFWAGRGHYAEAAAVLPAALALTPSDPTLVARARWSGAYVHFYGNDIPTALEQAIHALEAATSAGDEGTAARCLHTLGTAAWPGDPLAGQASLREAIERARTVGDPWCEADALQMHAYAELACGDLVGARAHLDEAWGVAQPRGGAFQEAWHHIGLAIIAAQTGDLDTAERHATEGRRIGRRIGDPAVESYGILIWAQTLVDLGRIDEATELLEVLVADRRDWGLMSTVRLSGLVTALRAHDAPGPAGDEMAALAERMVADGVATEALTNLWPLSAYAALDAGDLEAAAARAQAIREHEQFALAQIHADTVAALVERVRGGGGGDEVAHRALARIEDLGAIVCLPRTLAAVAGLALDSGSTTEATRLLAASDAYGARLGRRRSPAEQRGFDDDVAQARGLLGAGRFDVAWAEGAALGPEEAIGYARRARGERGRPSHGWASLTPTEEKVVALVVEGLTNPQIAEKLLMGRETVKTHLTHIYGKVGVANRTELAAATVARREGASRIRNPMPVTPFGRSAEIPPSSSG